MNIMPTVNVATLTLISSKHVWMALRSSSNPSFNISSSNSVTFWQWQCCLEKLTGITLQNKVHKLPHWAARVMTYSNYDADAGNLFTFLKWKNLSCQWQIQRLFSGKSQNFPPLCLKLHCNKTAYLHSCLFFSKSRQWTLSSLTLAWSSSCSFSAFSGSIGFASCQEKLKFTCSSNNLHPF